MKLLKTILVTVLVITAAGVAEAQDTTYTIDRVKYRVYSDEGGDYAAIVGYDKEGLTSFDLVIPETVTIEAAEYPVKKISNYAFYSNPNDSVLSSVTFSKNLIEIGYNAFSSCKNLTTVNWYNYTGNNIKTINDCAFQYCPRLKSIWMPGKLEVIPNDMFAYCDSLKTVYISCDNLTEIGQSAFTNCPLLTTVTISAPKLTRINDYAFFHCAALKSISIPDRVEWIGKQVFYRCFELRDIKMPKQLRHIGDEAFFYTGDSDMEIGDLCEDIGGSAFQYTALSKLSLPGELKSIGYNCFWSTLRKGDLYNFQQTPLELDDAARVFKYQVEYPTNSFTLHVPSTALEAYQNSATWSYALNIVPCDTLYDGGYRYDMNVPEKKLTLIKQYLLKEETTSFAVPSSVSIKYPDGTEEPFAVTGLGGEAFKNMDKLESVNLNNVDSIGYGVFSSCLSLKSFKGDKLRKICQRAFEYCNALEAVDLPATTVEVGSMAFTMCGNIASVTVRAAGPPATVYGVFSASVYETATLFVPEESLELYKAANGWKEFANIEAISDVVVGDINGDGQIDGSDVSALLEMVLEGGLTEAQMKVADLTGDGDVDGSDVSALLEIVLSGD